MDRKTEERTEQLHVVPAKALRSTPPASECLASGRFACVCAHTQVSLRESFR